MQQYKKLFIITLVLLSTIFSMQIALVAQGQPPESPKGPMGIPFMLAFMPGDSAKIPVEFFESVPADSQVSGFAFTLVKNSSDLKFHGVDTAATALSHWTVDYTMSGDSIRVQANAPGGVYFTKPDGPPALLCAIRGMIYQGAAVGDSIGLQIRHVSIVKKGQTVALPDSMFGPSMIKLQTGDTPPQPGNTIAFTFLDTQSWPDSSFSIDFAVTEPVPADSQVSRIRGVMEAIPNEVMWSSSESMLSPQFSGWSLIVTPESGLVEFDLEAPNGTYLVHDGNDPFVIFSLGGNILSTSMPGTNIEVQADRLFLTIKGTELVTDPDKVHSGFIKIMGDEPPPPPPGNELSFSFGHSFSKPDSGFGLDFMITQPIPADSQLIRIHAKVVANPTEVIWTSNGQILAPELSNWALDIIPGDEFVEFELMSIDGSPLVHDGQDPFIVFNLTGVVKGYATPDHAIEVVATELELEVNNKVVTADPQIIMPGKIMLDDGENPPPPPDHGYLFSFNEAISDPGSYFNLMFALTSPVPPDSQLSRIRMVVQSMPPALNWAETGHSLQPIMSDWTLTVTPGPEATEFDLVAPPGVFLATDSSMSGLNLVLFSGEVAPDAPAQGMVDVQAKELFLTLNGVEKTIDPITVQPGKVLLGNGEEPPPGQQSLFAFFDTFSKPDSNFAMEFAITQPIPADSQLSRICAVVRAMPQELDWSPTGHMLAPGMESWSLNVTVGNDSMMFDIQAPTGQFITHDAMVPLVLATFVGGVRPSASVEQNIEVKAENLKLTIKGIEHEFDPGMIQPGKVRLNNNPDGPPPGGESLFIFFDTNAEPGTDFLLDFAVAMPVPADSEISRLQIGLKIEPNLLVWNADESKVAEELADWTLTSTAAGDSMEFDLQSTSGSFLVHDGFDPYRIATLAGSVQASAPQNAIIQLTATKIYVTMHGVVTSIPPTSIPPVKIMLGGHVGPPPPPPPPPPPTPISSGDGRMNLGLYGGSVADMAYDEVHDIVLAALSAPQSVFISADSGLTWTAAFPYDSLEFWTGQERRGFGGRADQVQASLGYCYAKTSQEAGTLTGSQVSFDGINWKTLLDPYMVGNLLGTTFPGQANGQYAIGSLSTYGPVALVSAMNFVFRTTDAGQTWDISVVPNSTAFNTDKTITTVELCRDDPTGRSFYVVLTGNNGSSNPEFYRTHDGVDFSRIFIVSGADTVHNVMGITTHPYASDTLWAAAVDEGKPTLGGLWRSYDAGANWTMIYPGGNPHNAPMATIYEDISYPGPNNLRIFIVGENKYSDDLGTTWVEFSPQTDPYVDRGSNARAGIGHVTNTDIYFAMGDGAPSRSTTGIDGYYLFVPTGLEGINIWDIAQVPNQVDKVYLATSVGIAYTSEFTNTALTSTQKWASPYGNYPINPAQGGNTGFTAIEIDPNNTLHVVAANGNAIFVTMNGGFTNNDWDATQYSEVSGLDESEFKGRGGQVSQITFITSDTLIASVFCEHSLYGVLMQSTDGGYTWSTMPQAGEHAFRTVIAAWNSAQDSVVLYAGGGHVTEDVFTHATLIDSGAVYRSEDRGATWSQVSTAPHGVFNPAPYPLPINNMMAKPGSLDTLYMACGENLSNAIVRTFDGGVTLESLSMAAVGMFEGAFEAVAINKNHPDSVYFAVRRDILVYDAASNTTATMFRGYPGELTHALLFDELTMGSSSGFYQLTAPTNTDPSALDGKKATIPTRVELAQNYPNPFNPSTSIIFSLPQDGNVKLEVFNLIGQRVATLLSEPRKAGEHRISYQADDLASGIYFYRLQVTFANGQKRILSKKLMVIK
ncbi:T9SS type A sorting domain-containing protein [candidate division KSB1 bacterium]|nr:T9SS type A sorting domain-containing protein [candidate division KSB1 bacterium]